MKEKQIIRISTTGSVDDGKSTLIGRLMYETGNIFEDQYKAIENTCKKAGKEVDLSLLLDGLEDEREQGITIDVAYRYFSTKNKKIIIADSPGHEQYTRNMVTGASSADLAIIIIDAKNGIFTQSKRHGFILSLLQVPHLIVAINKMDTVNYSENIYDDIVKEYKDFSSKLGIKDIKFIPVSALKGDNVTKISSNMPWYNGQTILDIIETTEIVSDRNLIDFRLPIQNVLRPNKDFRGFTGLVASGAIKKGEEVIALPSHKESTVKEIYVLDKLKNECCCGQSIVVTLEDEIDISRGDMIVRKNNLPEVADSFEATICWMDESPSKINKEYLVKHTSKKTKAFIEKINYIIDINNLHRIEKKDIKLNEIAKIQLTTTSSLFIDPYTVNRNTGNFIIIDPDTNKTVAAGVIKKVIKDKKPTNIKWESFPITRELWEQTNGHKGLVVWMTGLSGSGKSTIAKNVLSYLVSTKRRVISLDGDNIRHGICSNLGFSSEDRDENIRRVGEVAKLFYEQGNIVICTTISPTEEQRSKARSLFPEGFFLEVFVDCSLEECERRDVKGLYKKARNKEILGFTGIDSVYEAPKNPELIIDTQNKTLDECVKELVREISKKTIL